MTALAQCLLDMGHQVSGFDTPESFVTQNVLDSLPIAIDTTQPTSLPKNVTTVIYGSAHGGKNHPLVLDAINKGLNVTTHAKLLGELSKQKQTLAVCGVGGKSTTSALVSWTLQALGAQPSFHVGVGSIRGLQKTGNWTNASEFFITEADEYAENPLEVNRGEKTIPRFAYLTPESIICTNIEYDHPDVYSNLQHTQDTFLAFFSQLTQGGTLLWNADNSHTEKIIPLIKNERTDVTYLSVGMSEESDFQIIDHGITNQVHSFSLKLNSQETSYVHNPDTIFLLQILGTHNIRNAAYCASYLLTKGYQSTAIAQAMSEFQSTGRRLEKMSENDSTIYYDDYAHHPTEIRTTLSTLRQAYPSKSIVTIFQPHTFSRTQALLSDFAQSFEATDVAIICPVFGSARESNGNLSSQQLAKMVQESGRAPAAVYSAENLNSVPKILSQIDVHNTIVITMGAGDVYTLHDTISKQ